MGKHSFYDRHVGPNQADIVEMLETMSLKSIDELISKTVPPAIRSNKPLNLPPALSEAEFIAHMDELANKNESFKSAIGLGYYNTVMPAVIRRNILENPGWYTQYTPYQAEISQGRLEALLVFQTMIADLTGLEVANASLLDEATAAAEAMLMSYRVVNKRLKTPRKKVAISSALFPVNIDVLLGRAELLDIDVVVADVHQMKPDDSFFCAIFQYPDVNGHVVDCGDAIQKWKSVGAMTAMICDILSLALLKTPAEYGADIAVGSTQRFGMPMFYGGPHAAFFATSKKYIREIPGRIIGVSKDADGKQAYRMTLQTREQHIKRDKATSNICTAQALPAILSAMYAVYHGLTGVKAIAETVYHHTSYLAEILTDAGMKPLNPTWFDTLTVRCDRDAVQKRALAQRYNPRYNPDQTVSVSLDESTTDDDVNRLFFILTGRQAGTKKAVPPFSVVYPQRASGYFTHPVFHSYHSETELMRYVKRLENKDLSLTGSMIPLGSCTMKLNSAASMIPIAHPRQANIHPFAPVEQAKGYAELIRNMENYLTEITGFDAVSVQPNSGAQGEYSGLKAIRNYFEQKGEPNRNTALIPESAHGTNAASAILCGMKIVTIKTDVNGNIDGNDLTEKARAHADTLAVFIVTYPSTYGVFEPEIITMCDIIHQYGGNVYMDGANMNAQMGITSPGFIGADVCHLNLHKTFGIPHGGGGPGIGPIGVKAHLIPFLPNHPLIPLHENTGIKSIASAPWGSAGVLSVSYGYIRMLGAVGCLNGTKMAILNANYIGCRLKNAYAILYSGEQGYNAHELIIDLRPFNSSAGIDATDVAKRLMDYGFHAPTISFPVPGTMMIEPTESESKQELDRFCEAMLGIRKEIQAIVDGTMDKKSNPLKNAPHTIGRLTADVWEYPYSRKLAGYPVPSLKTRKFWFDTSRIDDAYGDRNIIGTCPPNM